jgi:hypothetical protein
MTGTSGAQTAQVQDSSTATYLPEWYNSLSQQLGGQIGSQLNALPNIQQSYWGGGVAPQGGVFGGGMATQPVTPQLPPPTPINDPNWTGGGYGGNNGWNGW